ncbi:tRNA epoxyqueuosine(34) reductase QueG [Crocosphaera sp. XPORK-15E]|uniref:tRNA epoxyqueuosine(34) reductase QueG n=1 Tax=Crocosphaera sp. XPORK-15E TaxID=3110247 RepID=UPI002B206436|nr:tRNA epoxyqueuosine(34) reductase QueG [Crocosphaera sp. XPORK-15E]MEA5532645.1 tRNA epoxyqueuosine(34) reductase QueG [Crocosphaera sp. XPORK-15E]
MQELTRKIKQKSLDIGFHKVGIADVDSNYQDDALSHLQTWLALGYHADMAWMNNPKRFDIRQCMPEVKSVISVALNYYTPHQHSEDKKYGKISRYGWGRDYHKVMGKKLKSFSQWLEAQDNNIKTRYYVDTGPIQDKVWAQRAGIGWIAKNGNLITREYGSWVFLGEILTNLTLIPDTPHIEHCGTCTRCLDACPTNAITRPFVVDANRCLAYHTIENRAETLPKDIVNHLEGWVAGCDICQEVCPWNQRFSTETDINDFQPYPGNLKPELLELADISQEEWHQKFTASALRRVKPEMWHRNARANLEV